MMDKIIRERQTTERIQSWDKHEIVDEIHALQDAVEQAEQDNAKLLGLLYDGHAVYQKLTPIGRQRTSHENVSDTLDAIVKALKGGKK